MRKHNSDISENPGPSNRSSTLIQSSVYNAWTSNTCTAMLVTWVGSRERRSESDRRSVIPFTLVERRASADRVSKLWDSLRSLQRGPPCMIKPSLRGRISLKKEKLLTFQLPTNERDSEVMQIRLQHPQELIESRMIPILHEHRI